ncbi:MAG: hypothetical protein GEU98_02215 [Pseudonocardiaceae bacterium]|nr:hypothetical protein [Pseudonocardiaceae bacterium]
MRVPLHSGISNGRKVTVTVLAAVLMLLMLPGLAFVLSVPALDLRWLGLTILAIGELGCVLLLYGIFRHAAWLENTTLVIRGMFRTRRCDLAAAPRIAIVRNTNQAYPRPELAALDPNSGRWVRVLLHRPASPELLDPSALRGLADAILTGTRPEPHAQHAHQIATGLRGWAGDPFAGFR